MYEDRQSAGKTYPARELPTRAQNTDFSALISRAEEILKRADDAENRISIALDRIHGPRPQEVGKEVAELSPPGSRIGDLHRLFDRPQAVVGRIADQSNRIDSIG